ncbi:hypothetical protein [Nocardioides caldifontis]|uniref:hypothetical protein n=1 Tax=Nocardioides caldifontis TaxID=2588938 RepID=UPI0011DF4AA1|nr:hypothetical protein [Nocardioides caldifontis]
MTEPQTGRATDDDRLVGDQKVQDTSTDPLTPIRIGQLFGLTAALAVALYVVRGLLFGRKQKTRSELLAEAARTKSEAAAASARKAAERAAKQAGPAAKEARKAADKAAKKAAPIAAAGAGAVTATAAKVGTEVAAKAVDVGGEVASKAAALGAGAAAVAAGIGEEVGDTVHGVQKKVRKTRRRLFVIVCLAIGYVLGARAGRERYDQIVAQAQKLMGRPEVQQARNTVADKLDDVAGSGSSQDSGPSATSA